jgi:HSP20 family protein
MADFPSLFDKTTINLNPFRSMARMQRQMDRMFDRMWNNMEPASWEPSIPTLEMTFLPACNISETDSHFLVTFDVPGVKKDDIKIDLRGNLLTVTGDRKEEYEKKGATHYQAESAYGSFKRTFELPQEVKAEQVEAEYEAGVLRLAIPKKEASKALPIKINEGKTGIFSKLLGHQKEESKTQH